MVRRWVSHSTKEKEDRISKHVGRGGNSAAGGGSGSKEAQENGHGALAKGASTVTLKLWVGGGHSKNYKVSLWSGEDRVKVLSCPGIRRNVVKDQGGEPGSSGLENERRLWQKKVRRED